MVNRPKRAKVRYYLIFYVYDAVTTASELNVSTVFWVVVEERTDDGELTDHDIVWYPFGGELKRT